MEWRAVLLALNQFSASVANRTVLLSTDNTTVVSYIRMNALPPSLSGDVEVTPLMSGDVVSDLSEASRRSPKCLRHFIPPEQTSTGGMDSEPECCKLCNHADQDTPGGSFRHQSQSSATTLCVTDVRYCSLPTPRNHETHLTVEIKSDTYEHVHQYLTGGRVYHTVVRNTLGGSFFWMELRVLRLYIRY